MGAYLNRSQVGVVVINGRTDVSKYILCYLLLRRLDIFLAGENAVSYDRAIALYSDHKGCRMGRRMYIQVLTNLFVATL